MESGLEEQLAAEVCGVLLVLSSVLVFLRLYLLWNHGNLSRLQFLTMLITLYLLGSGWLSFAYLLLHSLRCVLYTVQALLKALLLPLSLTYFLLVTGTDPAANSYSYNRLLTLLVTLESSPGLFTGTWNFSTVTEARRFLGIQSILIYQHSICLVVFAVVSIILELAVGEDKLGYASFDWDKGWVYTVLLCGVSCIIGGDGLITLGWVLGKGKGTESAFTLSVFFALILLFPTLQEFLVSVYHRNSDSIDMHGFLLAVEMSTACLSQFFLLTPPSLSPSQPLHHFMSPSDFSQIEITSSLPPLANP